MRSQPRLSRPVGGSLDIINSCPQPQSVKGHLTNRLSEIASAALSVSNPLEAVPMAPHQRRNLLQRFNSFTAFTNYPVSIKHISNIVCSIPISSRKPFIERRHVSFNPNQPQVFLKSSYSDQSLTNLDNEIKNRIFYHLPECKTLSQRQEKYRPNVIDFRPINLEKELKRSVKPALMQILAPSPPLFDEKDILPTHLRRRKSPPRRLPPVPNKSHTFDDEDYKVPHRSFKRAQSAPDQQKTTRSRLIRTRGNSKSNQRKSVESPLSRISVPNDANGPNNQDFDLNWSFDTSEMSFKVDKNKPLSSTVSIGSIIDEVRKSLIKSNSGKLSDADEVEVARRLKSKKKLALEGKINSGKKSDTKLQPPEHELKPKSVPSNRGSVKKPDVFDILMKCQSRNNSTGSGDFKNKNRLANEQLEDDVFGDILTSSRNFSLKSKKKVTKPTRRTNSLESSKHDRRTNLINDPCNMPSPSPLPVTAIELESPTANAFANNSLTVSSSSKNNGIALLTTSPKRNHRSGGEYDERTRGRSRGNGGGGIIREPTSGGSGGSGGVSGGYDDEGGEHHHHSGSVRRRTDRDRERQRELERERDGALSSDAERNSSHQSTIDRSFSNNEGTPDDKIGKYVFLTQLKILLNFYFLLQTEA